MAHVIEEAKSGRARCRTCREAIAKGELRFGEEVPNAFGGGEMALQWHHLACAAAKKPKELEQAVQGYAGTIPESVLAAMKESAAKAKPATFPYAERAPTGRSKCLACEQPIEKDTLRIAVEREVEIAGQMRTSPGYLHPACAKAYTQDDELGDLLAANSSLPPAEMQEMLAKL